MNRKEIRVAVRDVLREPVPARWSDATLNTYINNAISEAEKTLMRSKVSTIGVEAGQEIIQLPSDCNVLNTLYWKNDEIKRQFAGLPMGDEKDVPSKYWLINDEIILRPIPNEPGTITIEHGYELPKLYTDDDSPVDGLDSFVKAHAVYEAYFDDGDPRFELWRQRKTEELVLWMNREMSNYSIGFRVDERF